MPSVLATLPEARRAARRAGPPIAASSHPPTRHTPTALQLYLRFGLPTLRPFPAAIQPWIQQAAQSTEFFHVMLAPLMLQSPQLWMGVVPLAVLAAFPALDALRARCGAHPLWQRYGSQAQAALETNKVCALCVCVWCGGVGQQGLVLQGGRRVACLRGNLAHREQLFGCGASHILRFQG